MFVCEIKFVITFVLSHHINFYIPS